MATAETIATALELNPPVVNESFSTLGTDVDMFGVNLVGGQQYNFSVDGLTGTEDAVMRVFDLFGNELFINDDDPTDGSVDPEIDFLAPYTGTFYIGMSALGNTIYDPNSTANRVGGGPGGTGDVDVTAGFNVFFPASNTSPAAFTDTLADDDGQVRVEYQFGTVDTVGDVDVGRFRVEKGDIVVIDVNNFNNPGTTQGAVGDPLLTIRDAANTVLQSDAGSGTGSESELIAVATSNSLYVGVQDNLDDGTGDFQVIIHRNPTMIGTSAGADNLTGTTGDDYIVGLAGADTITGDLGNDVLAGGDDGDTIDGGSGNDQIYGENGNDTLAGSGGSDVIEGGLGADTVRGHAGNDFLRGGAGGDTVEGGAGDDVMFGDDGNDIMRGHDGNDVIDAGAGNDTVVAGPGFNTVDGGSGADTIIGGGDDDVLRGGVGGDTIRGGDGVDRLEGGDNNDTMLGGLGADTLVGGLGIDTLTGNQDADVFDFDAIAEGIDTLTDFSIAQGDRIDISDVTIGVVNAGNFAQFVNTIPQGGGANAFVQVDADGFVGGSTFTTIALVQGVTAGDMFDFNNFIA